jgi:hypothetical protein
MQTRKVKKQFTVKPNVILAFMWKNKEFLPSLPNYGDFTIEEEIYRVRVSFWHDGKARYALYEKLAKKQAIPSLSEAKLQEILSDSTKAKYRDRKSPPFPANLLCGATFDGYISVKDVRGVCKWIPIYRRD